MRSSNKSRSRNKNNNRRPNNVGNVVNRVFDSAGPEGKVRGTPQQIIEKYQGLYRDAQLAGDRVAAENFQQHAEHYTRLLSEAQREINERRDAQQQQQNQNQQQNQGQNQNNNNNNNNGQQHQAQNAQQQNNPQPASQVSDGSEPQPDIGDSGLVTFDEPTNEAVELVQTPESSADKPARAPRSRSPRKPAAKKAAPAEEAPSAD